MSNATRFIGIIPAAGRGTRLAPLPFSKELFPLGYQQLEINGQKQWRPKAAMQYTVEQMITAGVRRVFIILGSGKSAIMEYYGNGARYGIHIAYLFQEKLTGIPFALDLARPWLSEEVVLFGMPDTIIQPADAYARVLQTHLQRRSDVTLGVFPTSTPWKFGMVQLDEHDRVIRNVDKPQQTDLKYMWGFACWSPSFTRLIVEFLVRIRKPSREVVLSEVFQYAHERGLDIRAVRFEKGEYIDIGTIEELQVAITRFSAGQEHRFDV